MSPRGPDGPCGPRAPLDESSSDSLLALIRLPPPAVGLSASVRSFARPTVLFLSLAPVMLLFRSLLAGIEPALIFAPGIELFLIWDARIVTAAYELPLSATNSAIMAMTCAEVILARSFLVMDMEASYL